MNVIDREPNLLDADNAKIEDAHALAQKKI